MSAVDRATKRGHAMRPSKRPLATNVRRWECARCGAAAIEYDGNEYGLAVESPCPGSVAA